MNELSICRTLHRIRVRCFHQHVYSMLVTKARISCSLRAQHKSIRLYGKFTRDPSSAIISKMQTPTRNRGGQDDAASTRSSSEEVGNRVRMDIIEAVEHEIIPKSIPETAKVNNNEVSSTGHIKPTLRELRLVYSFPRDMRQRVRRVHVPIDASTIPLEQILDTLVADGTDISHVSSIRVHSYRDGGFISLSEGGTEIARVIACLDANECVGIVLDDAVRDDTLEIQLDRTHESAMSAWMGPTFSIDANIGGLWQHMDPLIRFKWLGAGVLFRRVYEASIQSFGIKPEFAIRCQVAMMLRPPTARLYKHEPIELGRGLDICWGFHFGFVTFKETNGVIVYFGLPIGLAAGIHFIRRGQLIAVRHPENTPLPPQERKAKIDHNEHAVE